MRPRVILALSLSAVLILGAFWVRTTRASGVAPGGLVAVANPILADDASTAAADQAKLDAFYGTDTSGNSTSSTSTDASDANLTDTDLIARSMLSDYASLSANGQATQDNLDTIGDNYADNIISTNKAPVATLLDLNTVPNSNQALQAYSKGVHAIDAKYQVLLAAEFAPNIDFAAFGPDAIAAFGRLAKIYTEEASELKALPTPGAALSTHLLLVNHVLRSAWDMSAIANSTDDPTDALSALAAENTAGDERLSIITNIDATLRSNGIIIPNQ